MFIFVLLGAGEEVRDVGVLFDLRSEISVPAAEGGARGLGAWAVDGGLGVRARGGVGCWVT